jgi:hypothetical protein
MVARHAWLYSTRTYPDFSPHQSEDGLGFSNPAVNVVRIESRRGPRFSWRLAGHPRACWVDFVVQAERTRE